MTNEAKVRNDIFNRRFYNFTWPISTLLEAVSILQVSHSHVDN